MNCTIRKDDIFREVLAEVLARETEISLRPVHDRLRRTKPLEKFHPI